MRFEREGTARLFYPGCTLAEATRWHRAIFDVSDDQSVPNFIELAIPGQDFAAISKFPNYGRQLFLDIGRGYTARVSNVIMETNPEFKIRFQVDQPAKAG